MKIRVALSSLAALAGTFACSGPSADPHATSEQRIEGADPGVGELAPPIFVEKAACSHALCATGGPLQAACDPCATALCAADPYCCSTEWDATCVGEVASVCGQSCTAPPPPPPDAGASTCAHPICATGAALGASCDACVTKLCAQDPYCCSVDWDVNCVGEVGSICGQTCN